MPDVNRLKQRLHLYLVLDPDHVRGDLVPVAAAAIRGGITALQLRHKGGPDRAVLDLARELRGIARANGVLFLVNDRVDIALAVGADGAHLGVDDLPLEDARRLGGPNFVLGYSPETDEQTAEAAQRGADYLGVGPVFDTATKPDAGTTIGLGTITRRAELAGIPVIGIGGITASTSRSVVDHGACGVAVVSAIACSIHPEAAAREFRSALQG